MRSALFWVITQRVVVISCRRFGTTYRPLLTLEDGTDRVSLNVGKIAITRRLMAQKSAVIKRMTFADDMQVTRANNIVAALRKMDDACLSAVFSQAIVMSCL
jgi:hypothetical protein